jgi:hypothetical protein
MAQDTLVRRMFLILHDPFTGKPGIGHDLLKCGLVAAALADLMLDRRLGMENDRIVVADPRGNGTDEVGAFVVESIQRQPSAHTVRSWVEALTEVLYELVARGLVTEGVVRREQGGRRLVRRSADRFPAVDLLRAARPRVRLEHMLRDPRDLDVAGSALAGIIRALGVERVLDLDRDRAAVKTSVAAAADHLPIDLKSLVDGVESAVSAISLTIRR